MLYKAFYQVLFMEKIIWQPDFHPGNNLILYLDKLFARQVLNKNLQPKQQDVLNSFASLYLKSLGEKCLKPYAFYEDSGLIIRLDIGREDITIIIDPFDIKKLINGEQDSKPVQYHSVNISSQTESCNFMALFNLWVKYADAQLVRK